MVTHWPLDNMAIANIFKGISWNENVLNSFILNTTNQVNLIISWDNGLAPGPRQAIISTYDEIWYSLMGRSNWLVG